MKLIHTGDLHLGKRVHEQLMLEEQSAALDFIAGLAEREHADAVAIAGDIYDRSVPPVEAARLFDDFITRLSEAGTAVIAVPGNHDSAERVGYAGRLLGSRNVFVTGDYCGSVPFVPVGCADVYMLPFIRPQTAGKALGSVFPDHDSAVRAVLGSVNFRHGRRNVLVAHQFVTACGVSPERSDSETISLGGADNVDVSAFDGFDYVALGHIHGPQRVGRESVRYSGSPLRYSFSECRHTKSVAVVELGEAGEPEVRLEPVPAVRQLYEASCRSDELPALGEKFPRDSYMHITLTDEGEVINAIDKVREVFPNTLLLDFSRTAMAASGEARREAVREKSVTELFADFYEAQTGRRPGEERMLLIDGVMREGGGS